jgi:hypothetical protein
MGLHQITKLCTSEEAITRMKRQPTKWEKIFASHSWYKRLISRMYKGLKILNSRTNNPINKWANE